MKDILKTREKDCRHCAYVAGMGERGSVSNSICNYIGVTEEMRPCLPGKCREAGVFKPRDAKKTGDRPKAKGGD